MQAAGFDVRSVSHQALTQHAVRECGATETSPATMPDVRVDC